MAKYHGKHYYLGAWGYVLLDILYVLPVIGLICLIVHSFSDKNENRRHYARSYWARLLLMIVILAIVIGALYLFAGGGVFQNLENAFNGSREQFVDVMHLGGN